MKAITLWQPWASLLACGAKVYETRSWATRYRGPIAIHAAAINPFKVIKQLDDGTISAMKGQLRAADVMPEQGDFRYLPLGSVIATAELVRCYQIEQGCIVDIQDKQKVIPIGEYAIYGNELLFGDWTPGRYAWEFDGMKMLSEPIPTKGRQGLWTWESAKEN